LYGTSTAGGATASSSSSSSSETVVRGGVYVGDVKNGGIGDVGRDAGDVPVDGGWGVLGMPRQDVCLAPGDVLYIPAGWGHDVESTTATVSAALRFDVGATTPDVLFASAFDM
jgi:hypothetical protein